MAELPEMIGKYKIDSLIAKGGMGAVYKALHPTLKRYVILKKLTIKGNSAITERFKREARIMMDFNNERIVSVYDHFKEGSSQYIVLEFVDGLSLEQLIRKRRYLSAPMALLVFLDACRALRYAHEKGVIHRDIKPGNILISRKGEVKLADFGIASTEEEEESDLTKEGMTLGTPSYMPPEQFKNSKNVDNRADIYSMGIMLYEMLTGKKPFPGNFSPETILRIQKGRYQRARKINPDVPRQMDKLVAKLIKPDPRKRFQDMDAVTQRVEKLISYYDADELRATLALFITEKETEEPRWRRRAGKKWLILPAILLFLGLAGGGAYAYFSGLAYEWIWPAEYAKADFLFQLPSEPGLDPDQFILGSVYAEEGGKAAEKATTIIPFILKAGEGSAGYADFLAEPLYLGPGSYRLKIDSRGRTYWKDFSLKSIAELGNSKPQRVDLSASEPEVGPFTLYMEAYGAIGGENLSSIALLQALIDGEWRVVDYLDPELLVTGRKWELRVAADGYATETYTLRVPKGQASIKIQALLIPLDGSLTIELPEGAFEIEIDGKASLSSGKDLRPKPIPALKAGKNILTLHSGTHTLTVKKGGISKDLAVALPAEGKAKIKVSPLDDSFALKLEE